MTNPISGTLDGIGSSPEFIVDNEAYVSIRITGTATVVLEVNLEDSGDTYWDIAETYTSSSGPVVYDPPVPCRNRFRKVSGPGTVTYTVRQ